MVVVLSKTDCQQREGRDFGVKKVERTTVTAKFIGVPIEIPNDCFSMSNYFIECTNDVLKWKLHKFWYHRWMWLLGIWVFGERCRVVKYCLVAFFIWESLCVAKGIFIISFLVFVLSCQYLTVCWASLLPVKKQPIVEGHSMLNDFVDININHVSAKYMYAVARDEGYGRLCTESGMIRFQVFNRKGLEYMSSARDYSVGMFFVSITLMGWAGFCIYCNGSVFT